MVFLLLGGRLIAGLHRWWSFGGDGFAHADYGVFVVRGQVGRRASPLAEFWWMVLPTQIMVFLLLGGKLVDGLPRQYGVLAGKVLPTQIIVFLLLKSKSIGGLPCQWSFCGCQSAKLHKKYKSIV